MSAHCRPASLYIALHLYMLRDFVLDFGALGLTDLPIVKSSSKRILETRLRRLSDLDARRLRDAHASSSAAMAQPAVPGPSTTNRSIAPEDTAGLREIGQLASWSVSSSKPGFAVEQLLDPHLDTLWQSEGPQPHMVNIQFSKRMPVAQVSIFVDVTLDDSYTPSKISLRAGSYFADLVEIKLIELDQPRGWQHIKLGLHAEAAEGDEIDPLDPDAFAIRAHLIQVAVLANHLNGKDTHVRHIRIYAPQERDQMLFDDADDLLPWTTEAFQMHTTVR